MMIFKCSDCGLNSFSFLLLIMAAVSNNSKSCYKILLPPKTVMQLTDSFQIVNHNDMFRLILLGMFN